MSNNNFSIIPENYYKNDFVLFSISEPMTEMCDNHGYVDSDTVGNIDLSGNAIIHTSNFSTLVINDQINPLMKISTDFSKKQQIINKNVYDLSSNIAKITNRDKTGLRDDLSGNPIYDYNTPFIKDKPKSLLDGLITDNMQLNVQENALNVLGTITAASLIVLAIAIAKE